MRLTGTPGPSLYTQVAQIAKTLPPGQRATLQAFLDLHRVLMYPWVKSMGRLRYWLHTNPGRSASHERLADELGMQRETVTRNLAQAFVEYHRDGRTVL